MTLSQMIVNPQKRVQRAVLSAISAISVHGTIYIYDMKKGYPKTDTI